MQNIIPHADMDRNRILGGGVLDSGDPLAYP